MAVVTGTTSGVGRATARRLAAAGATVIGVARRDEREVDAIVPEPVSGSYRHVTGDASQATTAATVVDLAIAEYGRVDILVNNAGMGHYADLVESDVDLFDQMMATNVRSTFVFTRAVVDTMITQRSGLILTISSQAGLDGYGGEAIYCATKHAQVGFSRALRKELQPFGIKVGVICPAGIETDFAVGRGRTPEGIATAGYLSPDDVADVVLFATSQSRIATMVDIGLISVNEP
ncbi:SDR family oxidoreductase [Dactylosporangium sp. NPDC051485]|uniref:SDR family oxidoreductase n=1 Tax=Dactylosporangium sp. NPDC051485 TaxID=3154846 RepID=UPI003426045B